MNYVLTYKTGTLKTYPYTLRDLQNDNPNTRFPKNLANKPDVLADFNVYSVASTSKPLEDHTKVVEEAKPENIDGVWTQKWKVRNATEAELSEDSARKATEARTKRNALLAETDYLALTDNTLTTEMQAYRQALRDVTNQAGFPYTIDWPTKPV